MKAVYFYVALSLCVVSVKDINSSQEPLLHHSPEKTQNFMRFVRSQSYKNGQTTEWKKKQAEKRKSARSNTKK